VFSATKSVTSTLVGIAVDEGELSLDDEASDYIPAWRGTPSADVTVRDLVSNVSGREWSLALDYGAMLAARDKTRFAIDLGQDEAPGTVWAYNNSAIQTLSAVLEAATGVPARRYAREKLFGPLGMRATEMTTDPAGNTLTFMGVRSTCRDLARFGLLFLERGRFGDRQVVSADWVQQATGAPSTELNAAYGYLWWLNREGVLASPTAASSVDGVAAGTVARGQLVPGAPADMFWAIGLGNQIVQVDPGSRTVVVRLGIPEARPQPPTFGTAAASRVVTEALLQK
jgi:CubicO group peptidase (beta-lactamase class C family)